MPIANIISMSENPRRPFLIVKLRMIDHCPIVGCGVGVGEGLGVGDGFGVADGVGVGFGVGVVDGLGVGDGGGDGGADGLMVGVAVGVAVGKTGEVGTTIGCGSSFFMPWTS
jgi:hypothetical protein